MQELPGIDLLQLVACFGVSQGRLPQLHKGALERPKRQYVQLTWAGLVPRL